jgi:enolase
VNQIGSLSEAIAAVTWRTVRDGPVSSRIGLGKQRTARSLTCRGLNTGQIKTGAPARSDRVAKYNRLLRIEGELADNGRFAGMQAFRVSR